MFANLESQRSKHYCTSICFLPQPEHGTKLSLHALLVAIKPREHNHADKSNKLTLYHSQLPCRWNASNPADIDNLVLLTFDEADQRDENQVGEGQQAFEQYVAKRMRLVQSEYQLSTHSR